jgi:PAS domain S-box-containing protein
MQPQLDARRSPLLLLCLLAAGIIVSAVLYVQHEITATMRRQRQDLLAIAAMKSEEVEAWGRDRIAYAELVRSDAAIAQQARQYFAKGDAGELAKELRQWLRGFAEDSGCERALLLDAAGQLRMAVPTEAPPLDQPAKSLVQEALQSRCTRFSPLSGAPALTATRIDLVAPLLLPRAGGPVAVGALLLRIDPVKSVHHLVRSWPTPTRTAECLLARREGDQVVLLSQTRHTSQAPGVWHVFVSCPRTASSTEIAAGTGKIIEGPDYRGVPVVAAVQRVDDSPWYIVAKVDREEVFAPVRTRAAGVALIVGSLLLAAIAGLALWWRHQKVRFYRAQLEIELSHHSLAQRYDYLTRFARDAILLLDEQGYIIEANDSAVTTYGYPREELYRLRIRQIRAPESLAQFAEQYAKAHTAEGTLFETTHLRKDGSTFAAEVGARRILLGDRTFILSVIRDISERTHLEDQLRQALKMEAVGRLAGGVAHDFNNMLTVIIGHSQVALADLPAKDLMRHRLNEIYNAAERASALTRQLLAFSRRQILRIEVVDVNAIISGMQPMLRRLIGEDIDLVVLPKPELGRVKADRSQFEQVILNLAINSRDAMPKGGELIVETGNVMLDEAYAGQHLEVKPGPYVLVAVSDTGQGMDDETKARIFEPFFTTKEQGKGTGLGLSTVHGIVKQCGGHIWVYSEVGHGTTFKIYFPRTYLPLKSDGGAETASDSTNGRGTVLIVEDEQMVLGLVRNVLQAGGYSVLEASNGVEALAVAERYQGAIDVLLTDVVMPGISGRDLAQRLRTLRPEIKIIFISGYTNEMVFHQDPPDAAVSFLQKPFSPDALSRKVQDVVHGG